MSNVNVVFLILESCSSIMYRECGPPSVSRFHDVRSVRTSEQSIETDVTRFERRRISDEMVVGWQPGNRMANLQRIRSTEYTIHSRIVAILSGCFEALKPVKGTVPSMLVPDESSKYAKALMEHRADLVRS